MSFDVVYIRYICYSYYPKFQKMKKNYTGLSAFVLTLLFLTIANSSNAQNISINAAGTGPDGGAMLDISSANKGLLVPRVNIANLATIDPITGSSTISMLVFNTNAATGLGYHYWDGTRWAKISTSADWELTGNAGTNVNTNFLGTTDNRVLRIRTNNANRFEFTTNGSLRAFGNGTAGAPTYSWTANANMGMFRATTNAIGFSTAGVERMRILGNGNIGIRTANPSGQLQMTNGGLNIGANAMASFDNYGTDGVALSGYNHGAGSGYNGIEGITSYSATAYLVAGVVGFALDPSLTHQAIGVRGAVNGRDGIGVLGSRQNSIGLGYGGLFLNDLGYTGGLFLASDEQLKTNIVKIENAISIIDRLSPVSYNYDLEHYPSMGLNTGKEFGFIAQQVQLVLPEIVRDKFLPTNGTEEVSPNGLVRNENKLFLTMDYTRLIPIAIQGIKEQQAIIESQNERIEALEEMILELKNAIETK